MKIKGGVQINNDSIILELKKIINQVYKLLPLREEGADWEAPLSTLIVEISGMNELLIDQQEVFPLLCKLKGLYSLDKSDDFFLYRRTIFDCLSLLSSLVENINGNR